MGEIKQRKKMKEKMIREFSSICQGVEREEKKGGAKEEIIMRVKQEKRE